MANFGHLVAFKKAVLGWHKAENMRRSVLRSHADVVGKPTKILHNVAVGVVLNDVLDPLIAVLISATLRFSRMASSGLGNVDLSEVLFALENVDESPEIWVVCSYIRLETAMPTFNCIVSSWQVIYGLVVHVPKFHVE